MMHAKYYAGVVFEQFQNKRHNIKTMSRNLCSFGETQKKP